VRVLHGIIHDDVVPFIAVDFAGYWVEDLQGKNSKT
jgi:hypothetical protein